MSFISYLLFILYCQAKTVIYNLTITNSVEQSCLKPGSVVVNGQYPGPTIYATKGDLLIVNVTNNLIKEEFTMHFHGIDQIDTPFYDGVPFITQLPIPKGKSFVHKIKVLTQGSYYYHSHTGNQAISALGALVIHDTPSQVPFKFDEERIILLTENLAKYKTGNKTNIDIHSSQGLNFMGLKKENCKPEIINIDGGKKYLIRLIGATTKSYITFSIKDHLLEVVSVEGYYIKPKVVDKITLHSGQRYIIILRTKNFPPGSKFPIVITEANFAIPMGISYLTYQNNNAVSTYNVNEKLTVDNSLRYEPLIREKIPKANKKFYLRVTNEEKEDENSWLVNNYRFKVGTKPLLKMAYEKEKFEAFKVNYGDVVEFVIQNTYDLSGTCDTHPWHLHGSSFWDVAEGNGTYSKQDDENCSKVEYAIRRDTFNYHNYQKDPAKIGQDCGWYSVRYIINNPGVWLFHCHILGHMELGMQFFIDAATDRLPSLPKDIALF